MADIKDILKDIANGGQDVDKLTNSLKALTEARNEAFKSGDIKLIDDVNKLERAVNKLVKAEVRRKEISEEVKKAAEEEKEIDQELIAEHKKLTEEYEKAARVIKKAEQSKIDEYRKAQKKVIEHKEATKKLIMEHTTLGKGLGLLTSQIGKFAGALGVAGIAQKTFNLLSEASNLRTDIMIKSFKGLQKPIHEAGDSLNVFSSDGQSNIGKFVSGLKKSIDESQRFSAALSDAKETAIRMGMDAEDASKVMIKFARITGTQNPEALSKLTQGALAVSRALDIDVSEATEYVSARMDKFGGTAASAIIALDNMRKESTRLNNSMGRTIIRGDDLVRAISDITKQSDIYALNQRLVGHVITNNAARLQSLGESYENAFRKSKLFAETLTDKAPEWMKILSGQGLLSSMSSALNADKTGAIFMEKFGKDLDAAKPGLAKKVKDILADTSISSYDKSRLVQELTSGTEVGMNAMNDQILNLAKTSGSHAVAVLQKQMGISFDEAHSLVEQAKAWDKDRKEIHAAESKEADKLFKQGKFQTKEAALAHVKELGLVKESIKLQQQQKLIADDRKKIEQGLLQNKQDIAKKEKDIADIKASITEKSSQQERDVAEARMEKLKDEIADLKVKSELTAIDQRKSGLADQIQQIEKELRRGGLSDAIKEDKEKQIEALKSQMEDLDKKRDIIDKEGVAGIEKATQGLKDSFLANSILTGDIFKEGFQRLQGFLGDNLSMVGIAALGVTAIKIARDIVMIRQAITGKVGLLDKLMMVNNKGGKGGGGFFGGGGGDGPTPPAAPSGKPSMWQKAKEKMQGSKVGQAAGKLGGITRLGGKAMSGMGKLASGAGKMFSKFGGPLGKIVGIAGAASTAMPALAQGNIKGAAKALLPNVAGLAGGAIGSVIGSVIPGPGTVAGGLVGSMIGDKIGEFIGGAMGPDTAMAGMDTMASQMAMASPSDLIGNISGPNPDGSVNIRIPNFMNTFAKGSSMAKKAPRAQ